MWWHLKLAEILFVRQIEFFYFLTVKIQRCNKMNVKLGSWKTIPECSLLNFSLFWQISIRLSQDIFFDIGYDFFLVNNTPVRNLIRNLNLEHSKVGSKSYRPGADTKDFFTPIAKKLIEKGAVNFFSKAKKKRGKLFFY